MPYISPFFSDTISLPLEALTSVSETTVPVEESEASIGLHIYEPQEMIVETTPTPTTSVKRKRNLNDMYESVQAMATSQIVKNKKKVLEMSNVCEIKQKIQETELQIKEEELEARRRKYEAEEEESQLRREILKVELEIAKAKLDQAKRQF